MATWMSKTLAILLCALAAAPALAAEKTFDRHFTAAPGGKLTLQTDIGSIAVVGSEGSEVVLHVDMSGSDEFLSRMNIKAVQNNEDVTVTGQLDRSSWYGGWFGPDWFGLSQQKVRYTLQVPPGYAVDLRTSGGGLDVRHMSASVRAATSGGSVLIRDISGQLYARTSGGRIDAANLNGPAQLHTSGGSIEVSGATGPLDVSTSGGGIRLDHIGGKVRAVTSGGSVKANMTANQGISLGTSGGNIILRLPEELNGSIDAHTSGGHVESDIALSSTEVARHGELIGSIHEGGAPIVLRTSGGSIRVARIDDR